jgi:hypothetical protein
MGLLFLFVSVLGGWVTPAYADADHAAEIVEIQSKILKFFTTMKLDVEWQVVNTFDRVRLKKVETPRLDFPITLFLSREQAEAVDTGRPTTLGGRPRTYAFFLGKGLASTTYGMLSQMFSEVSLEVTDAVPSNGLALGVALSDFSFGYPGFVSIKFESSMTLTTHLYLDGTPIGSQVYHLKKFRGPHSFQIVNSENTEINMMHSLAELIYQAQNDLYALAQNSYRPPAETEVVYLDMFKVIQASRGWDFYARERASMTEDERTLARYLHSLSRAYDEKNTDYQAQTLAELRDYVRTRNLSPSSREGLINELKIWHSMRETQQAGINRADDRFYNFFGDQTDTVITVAELIPDVAKIGVLAVGCTNPATCPLLLAQLASFEKLETTAKVVGASSAEYLFGSGELNKAAFAGTKAFVLDRALDRAASLGGKAITGQIAHSLSGTAAKRSVARLTASGYSEDFARHVAGQIYVNRMEKIIERSATETASKFVSGKIAETAAKVTESGLEKIQQVRSTVVQSQTEVPDGPLKKIK